METVKIISTSRQPVPALRFIGKKYSDADRVDGLFSAKWDDWFENDWFSQLEALGPLDGWADYMGLMGHEDGEFKYWIGMFLPADTPVPDGFGHMDYPACNLGVCRLHGREDSIYGNEPMCCDRLQQEGDVMLDQEFICFERDLACDDPAVKSLPEGEMLLDICFFIK